MPGQPVITSQYVLRISIFIVLVLAILLMLFSGFPQVAIPADVSVSGDVLTVSNLFGGLAGGVPVLLAVDYDPGFSGEMDAATGVVLEDLMRKGAFLTMVATSPTGPIQAERLLSLVKQTGNYAYNPADQYVNLGYVPGGPAGLLSFAQDPRSTLPLSTRRVQAWGLPALQGVNSAADFALVVVATENPDTARAWVEQVQPVLARTATPLVIVTSAQAEPVVRPYYDALPRQVDGLLSGLAAVGVYENLLGRVDGSAHTYWSPFSVSVLIVLAIVVVGGGINAISALLMRRREDVEGGE